MPGVIDKNKEVLAIYVDNLNTAIPVRTFPNANMRIYLTNDNRYVLVNNDYKIMGNILTEEQYLKFIGILDPTQ